MTYCRECIYCGSRNTKYMSGYSDEVLFEWYCYNCDKYFTGEDNKK